MIGGFILHIDDVYIVVMMLRKCEASIKFKKQTESRGYPNLYGASVDGESDIDHGEPVEFKRYEPTEVLGKYRGKHVEPTK